MQSPFSTQPCRRRNGQQVTGQALVETAISIGIIVFLLINGIGMIQWLGARHAVAQAARAGAAVAAAYGERAPLSANARDIRLPERPSPTVVSSIVTAAVVLDGNPFTSPQYAVARVTCDPPNERRQCRRFDPVRMEIRYDAEPWLPTPLIPRITVTAFFVATYEQDPTVTGMP